MTIERAAPALLRHRGYWRWSAGVQLARLPATMAPLAFTVLTTATTGSYRLGGVMMAVFVMAELLGAVPAGRLLDRIGPGRGIVLILGAAAAGLAALATAAAAGAPPALLLVLVVVPGVVAGGLSGGFRTLLAGTVGDALLPRAIAVDAMLMEAVLIGGPVLVVLLNLVDSLMPLAAMAVVYVLAAVLAPREVAAQAAAPVERPRLPLGAAMCWLACLFSIGHLLSTIEVAPLPLAQRLGAGEAAAALIIAVLSGASIGGSALFAWRGRTTRRSAIVFLCGFVVGGVLVAIGPGWAGLLAGVALIGACTGPLLTVASVRLQRLLPEGRRSEGFSVAFAVNASGFGIGSLTVGLLPLHLAPLLGAGSATLACVILVVRPS
jgi:MFS family permease